MTTTKTYSDNVITIRGRAFNGKLETLKCMVDDDGTVRVYDSIAGHYTACHSLNDRTQGRIRKMAAE